MKNFIFIVTLFVIGLFIMYGEREDYEMNIKTALAASANAIPPIDKITHKKTETATFAMA